MDYFIALTALLLQPTLETLYMVILSTVVALILGFPIGIGLILTGDGGLRENRQIYAILNSFVNVFRSFPFIILMILLFPLSRILVGTTIGTTATIVPLAIGAAPFAGRIIEGALREVDPGVIEASVAMGTPVKDIIFKVMIPETLPSLILGITLTTINVVGYSAMAGAIGGGGLGDLAIRFGFHRFQTDVMLASVIIIILIVQGTQSIGNLLANRLITIRN